MIRLIGGEMPGWSDLDGPPGPFRGDVAAPLLAGLRGRMLIAGPHDPDLIAAVPAGELTLLVRGQRDAEALAARFPAATVCCGAPEKLAPEAPYDAIVALDGLGRLASAEGDELPWADAYALLTRLLADGGRLLLGLANPLGLPRLTALVPAPSDADWAPVADYDPTRPARLAQLRALTPAVYAAFPAAAAPAVLLGADLLADAELTGFLAATVAAATNPGEALTDPVRLAVDAVRHGLAAELAPGWIAVLNADATDVPAGLLPGATIARDAGGGWVRRDAAGATEPLPPGRTLEEVLIAACLRRDLPAVRAEVRAWQAGPAAGVPAARIVVGPGGALVPLGAAMTPGAALRAFADTLTVGGFAHPWPAPASAADLALTLAATAGLELEPDAVAGDEPTRRDLRELTAERDRLARELAEARAKAVWYEQMLTARENALHRAQRIVDLLSARGPARAGAALMGGMRAARRSARATIKKLQR